MVFHASWSSTLVLVLAALSSTINASPIKQLSGESAPVVAARDASIAGVRRQPLNWPYVSRRELARSLEERGVVEDSLPVLEPRKIKNKQVSSSSFSANSTSSASSTQTLSNKLPATSVKSTTKSPAPSPSPQASHKSTTSEKSTPKSTPSPTTKPAPKPTTSIKTTPKSSTDTTVKPQGTEKSTTEQSVPKSTLKSTTSTKKSSTTEKTTTLTKKLTSTFHQTSTSTKKSSKNTSPSPTFTHTVVIGTVTETLTVEPTSIYVPSPADTQISNTIVVPTHTLLPTGSPPPPPSPGLKLKFAIANNLNTTKAVHAYLTGINTSGKLVMLQNDGTFYVPETASTNPEAITADVALPLASGATQHYVLPNYISSARVWFSEGKLDFAAVSTSYGVGLVEPTVVNANDPSHSTYWGFAELTYGEEEGLFANLSFVDFVGLGIGMNLTTSNTKDQSAPGMHKNGTAMVCAALKAQAKIDGQPWGKLCEYDSNGDLLRVLSPSSYMSQQPNAFAGYFGKYADAVWAKYSSEPLIIESQNTLGQISCQVSGDTLNCNGDNRGYQKPVAADVFSCDSGPFAIKAGDNDVHLAVVPRLCAAFNRATLLVSGGNIQPALQPKYYYPTTPNNFYSKVVHSLEVNGEGYAFPYDDVAPTGNTDVAGIVASSEPKLLTLSLSGLLHPSS